NQASQSQGHRVWPQVHPRRRTAQENCRTLCCWRNHARRTRPRRRSTNANRSNFSGTRFFPTKRGFLKLIQSDQTVSARSLVVSRSNRNFLRTEAEGWRISRSRAGWVAVATRNQPQKGADRCLVTRGVAAPAVEVPGQEFNLCR